MKLKKNLPNIITSFRIFGAICLLFVAPLSVAFYALYTFCGLTDAVDGAIARAANATSELGAKLDSVADLLFYAVMLIRIFPVLWDLLPRNLWLIVLAAILIRLCSYFTVAVKYRRFASLHTRLNKVTGLLVFSVPYLIKLPFGVIGCYCAAVAGVISSLQELVIHLRSKEYPALKES